MTLAAYLAMMHPAPKPVAPPLPPRDPAWDIAVNTGKSAGWMPSHPGEDYPF
jgi:hypothetical protein